MANEHKGTIYLIRDIEHITDKFKKREFVIVDNSNPKYPQHILMQFVQDKCDKLNFFKKGDNVNVTFSLKGRMVDKTGQEKFFINAEAWEIAHC